MLSLVVALVVSVPELPPECQAPPTREVLPLTAFAQASGSLSVGLDSVATWCFDSSGTWTGGQAGGKGKPSAAPAGDCQKAIGSCEVAKAAISEEARALLYEALTDMQRPFLGQKYKPRRSGLAERPPENAECTARDRSTLFSQAQARMDLARLSSQVQSEYANYKTWLFQEGLRCAQLVARGEKDLTRRGIAIDTPTPGGGALKLPPGATAQQGGQGATQPGGVAGAPGGAAGTTGGTAGASGTNGAGTAGQLSAAGTSGGTAGQLGAAGTDGAAGQLGAAGPNGTAGQLGAAGTNGTAGQQGQQGAAGTNGTAGQQGAAGPNGTAGRLGAAGTTGTAGQLGAAGPNGTAGQLGAAGTNGTAGQLGAAGPNGTAGQLGAAGTNGTAGQLGAAGTNGTAGQPGAAGPNGGGAGTQVGQVGSTSGGGRAPGGALTASVTPPTRSDAVPLGGPTAERERALAGPMLEKWRYFLAEQQRIEIDNDWVAGFLASRELRDCRCVRPIPGEIVRRLENKDRVAQLEADDEKNTRCELCLLDAYPGWKVRAQKQCALALELTELELGYLQRSDDGNGLPPRCVEAALQKRKGAPAAAASRGTSNAPPKGNGFIITRAPEAELPQADPLKPTEYAPLPAREEGRVYVRIFTSAACVAEVLPGPVVARTGDLLPVPPSAAEITVRGPCGGFAELYFGKEEKPRVAESFARNQPLRLQFRAP